MKDFLQQGHINVFIILFITQITHETRQSEIFEPLFQTYRKRRIERRK